MPTSRQFKSFIKIADTGSFYKASESLFVTPTALIQQINLLESEIGFKLFERSHSGVTLTEAGSFFLQEMRLIDDRMSFAIEKGKQMSKSLTRVIRFGTASQHAGEVFFELHQLVLEKYPQLMLELVNSSLIQAIEDIRQKKLDCCILPETRALLESGLPQLPVKRLPVYIGVASGHPLAKRDIIRVSDLAYCSIILPQPGVFVSTDRLRKALADERIPVTVIEENDNLKAEALCIRHHACRLCTSTQAGSALKYIALETDISFDLYAVFHPDIKAVLAPVFESYRNSI